MTTLYELTANHRQLQELVERDDNELAEAIADTFEAIEGEFNDKAVSLIAVVNNLSSDTTAIDNEVKRLEERKKVIKNKQDQMREYLRMNMEAAGITNIKCPLFSITLAKGRDIVQIDDEKLIPAEYLNIKTTYSPMKADILKALKSGEEIPGASITKSSTSLRIK